MPGKIPSEHLNILKEASKYIDDKFQNPKYSYMHAMRAPGQTKNEALGEMRVFFVERLESFYTSNDYFALGEAFHSIMDAYSPVHRFHEWDNTNAAYYVPHLFEHKVFFPEDAANATDAIYVLYSEILNGKHPSVLFDEWVGRYTEEYPDVFN